MSSLGCLYVLKATDNPVMVGDMNVSQEELEAAQGKTPGGGGQYLSLIHI